MRIAFMSNLHSVDPPAREAVAKLKPLNPAGGGLDKLRETVIGMYADDLVLRQEKTVPGRVGASDVRVLIYQPERSEEWLPAILCLHGGGFIAGTPDMMATTSQKRANDSGAIVVAVNYRLAPETSFPGPLEDCYAALAWLFGEAEPLGIDRTRVAVLGQSAGGGLASALALLVRDRGDTNGPTS